MAAPAILQKDKDFLLYTSIFGDEVSGESVKSRGAMIERKIEILEGLACNVSNRRSRRLMNDRLLMELVPRLNAEEIRGLFAPPPWGEEAPESTFAKTNVVEWDKFRNIDMDKEADFIKSLRHRPQKRKSHVDSDKMAVLNAWQRIDCRTREALRRSFLPDLIEGYEVHSKIGAASYRIIRRSVEIVFGVVIYMVGLSFLSKCVRTFIQDENDSNVLVLQVQDPFHRLLLHGVCEFYNVLSVTETQRRGSEMVKMTKITKKKSAQVELPKLMLSHFLKMSKQGIW